MKIYNAMNMKQLASVSSTLKTTTAAVLHVDKLR